MVILFMQKIVYVALTGLFLVGCATHTPAPKPKGELFRINEHSLVKPSPQSIDSKTPSTYRAAPSSEYLNESMTKSEPITPAQPSILEVNNG